MTTNIVSGRRGGKTHFAWMQLLEAMQTDLLKPMTLVCESPAQAVASRFSWYRFTRMMLKNTEISDLTRKVLENRVVRLEGRKLIFEYHEPLHVDKFVAETLRGDKS